MLFGSCVHGTERSFTGSTAVNNDVRLFLSISFSDSIDFIRWKLEISDDDHYHLQCNYGIGKPNTDGFMNGGKAVELSGPGKFEKNIWLLQNGIHSLKFIELNRNLLHILNNDGQLAIGTGGWAYTLSSTNPENSPHLNNASSITTIKDSLVFHGRTPCLIPGLTVGSNCIKLKWQIVLYAAQNRNSEGDCHLRGTNWRDVYIKNARWKIKTTKDGYKLFEIRAEKADINMLMLDQRVLLFTDESGIPLTGNEDFSYTLSRK